MNDYLNEQGHAPDWPYPISYEHEQENDTDVLVLGGGIAGLLGTGQNFFKFNMGGSF